MRVAVIGLGKMGEAIARALVAKGFEVLGADVLEEKKRLEALGIKVYVNNNRAAAAEADVVLIAVKPGQVPHVLREIAGEVKGKLLISIAAGVPTSLIESLAPGARVVRVMPNICAWVREAAVAVAKGRTASKEDVKVAKGILAAMGRVVEVDERYMDAVTALSGSGPAYVFSFIEALVLGGLAVGLPRDVALKLAAQTVAGAAKMVLETGKHPAELRDMVTTPGGTTIEALKALEKSGFRGAVIEAVVKAYEKSKAISEVVSSQA